jgi:hypothetical protein
VVAPGGGRHPPRDVGGQVAALGQLPRGEPLAGRGHRGRLHPVDPEDPPAVPVQVPGHQVPAPSPAHQPVGLQCAPANGALVVPVGQVQALAVTAGGSQHGQHGRVHPGTGAVAGDRQCGRLHGVDPAAQPGRQHLLQFGQGAKGGLLNAADAGGGRTQPDRHRHGLLVIQQQRGQGCSRAEPVAGHAPSGVHRIAQIAEPLHVAADGPGAHPEPFGQLGRGPVRPRLQQRQEPQQPGRGFQHGPSLPVT